MTDQDDIDALAAEYVLGTLGSAERAAVAARRNIEPVLAAAIAAWEYRLGPLAIAGPSVDAPPGLLEKIEARIAANARQSTIAAPTLPLDFTSNVIAMERRMKRWRTAAVAASALAASLVLVIGVREGLRPTEPRNFVAVLQKDAASPAFLLSVDLDTKQLSIRAVAPERQTDKSYQLWLVNPQLGNPRSLGLIQTSGFTGGTNLSIYERGVIEGATYAVSLEPPGGSPTGQPTGPVLYAGKLVQATR
jgi:anti-sigma-K factor RskA